MTQPTPPPQLHTLKYTTRCRVPGCNTGPNGGPQEFTSSPLEIPIVGHPGDRVTKFVMALMSHLQSKHPEVMKQVSGSIAEFTGWLVVSAFACQDPSLAAVQERVRGGIHRASRRITLTDEQIQQRIAAVIQETGIEEADEVGMWTEGLNTLLQDMRDLLLEQGRYAPQSPTEKPLVSL